MVMIRIGEVEKTFQSSKLAMDYVIDLAGNKPLRFQRFVFTSWGGLEEMDFLTYRNGRMSETYNTRR